MPFLTTALGIGAIASGIGGAAASIAGSGAQADAAKSAAQLQAEEAQQALDFQKQVYSENVAREQPWIKAGTGAINMLSQLTSKPGKGLLTPWTGKFTAPTAAEAAATPGYKFQVGEGERLLQNSAAASGGLLTGGTLRGIEQYGQGVASSNYQNVFSNALTQYETAYSTFRNNQSDLYARLAGVSRGGEQAVTTAGQFGQQAAGNVANINLTTGAQQGQDIQNAAAATASGYAGAANAFSGTVSNLSGLAMLQKLLGNQPVQNPVV
jgi:hypothetical protein